MARKTTKAKIERFEELNALIDALTNERDILRLEFIDDVKEYGKTVEDGKGNKMALCIGKHRVIVTHVTGNKFSQKKFREENKAMYEEYKMPYEENRVSVEVPE